MLRAPEPTPLRDLAVDFRRFTVTSTVEPPLTVDATCWQHALRLVLELLELEDRHADLAYALRGDEVVAIDPVSGHRFSVAREGAAWWLEAQAA